MDASRLPPEVASRMVQAEAANNGLLDEDALIREQVEYYRAVAPEYAVVSSPPGDRLAPFAQQIERGLDSFRPSGRVLEIASGGGQWTVRLLRHASSITALDPSPEMHQILRTRIAGDARVRCVVADVFSWRPDRRYDVVFFANWLSHVPPGKFRSFWETIREALVPSGRVFFVDELEDAWRYEDIFREDFADSPAVPVVRRSVRDGSAFRIVKVFWNPEDLSSALHSLEWEAEISTAGPFFWGTARLSSTI
jgi:SAM-dependent methyltransferase